MEDIVSAYGKTLDTSNQNNNNKRLQENGEVHTGIQKKSM